MSSNYEDVLGQLTAEGLQVTSLEIGKLRRCKVEGSTEKRGWYHLHEIRLANGHDLIVGSFGVWRGDSKNTMKVEITKNELNAEQRESIRKRQAEDLRNAEAARKADAERAALQLGRTMRDALAALRRRIAPDLAAATGVEACETILAREHNLMLVNMAKALADMIPARPAAADAPAQPPAPAAPQPLPGATPPATPSQAAHEPTSP